MTSSHDRNMFQLWEGQEKPFYRDNALTEYEEEAWGVPCAFDGTWKTIVVLRSDTGTVEFDDVRIID